MTVPTLGQGPESAPQSQPAAPPRGRPRPVLRRVEVSAVTRLTPRLVSVTLSGEELAGFAVSAPTSHIKVFLPSAPGDELRLPDWGPQGPDWGDGPRPVVRTYTPRRWDPVPGTLDVEFVLHGEGPASAWASSAAVGDQLAIAGPGGRFTVDEHARQWWIGGDESALPAIATLLEALPAEAEAQVHVEVESAQDEVALSSPATVHTHWHHRGGSTDWGSALQDAVRDTDFAAGTAVWVAAEASAVRAIRKVLLTERGLPAATVTTRGYWRTGTADHPDHDYGE